MGGKFSPVCSCYSRPRRLWLLWKGTLQSWFFKNSFTNSSHFSASVQLHHNQRNTEIPELKDAFWVLHDIPLSHLNKSCCLCKAASSTGYLPALTQLKVKTTSLRDITITKGHYHYMKESTSKKQAKFEGDISVSVVNFYGTVQNGKDRAAFVW